MKEDISIIAAGQLSVMATGHILKKSVMLLRILDICVVSYDLAREFPLLLHQQAKILTLSMYEYCGAYGNYYFNLLKPSAHTKNLCKPTSFILTD